MKLMFNDLKKKVEKEGVYAAQHSLYLEFIAHKMERIERLLEQQQLSLTDEEVDSIKKMRELQELVDSKEIFK